MVSNVDERVIELGGGYLIKKAGNHWCIQCQNIMENAHYNSPVPVVMFSNDLFYPNFSPKIFQFAII